VLMGAVIIQDIVLEKKFEKNLKKVLTSRKLFDKIVFADAPKNKKLG